MKNTSLSNHAGVMGTRGISKSGNARINGTIATGASSKGGGGKVRQNGTQPSTEGQHSDPGRYLGPKAKNAESMKPSKSGSVR